MKKFWSKLKGWQKGLTVGLLIGLIINILLFIIDSPSNYIINNLFFGYILPLFFMFTLPTTLIGVFIGFLTSLKNKFIWIFALIFGLFGLINCILAIGEYWFIAQLFAKPIVYLLTLVFGHLEYSTIIMSITLFLSFIIYALIGLLIGFSIEKIRRNK